MNELMQNSLDKIDRMFAEMDDEEFLRQYNECCEPLTSDPTMDEFQQMLFEMEDILNHATAEHLALIHAAVAIKRDQVSKQFGDIPLAKLHIVDYLSLAEYAVDDFFVSDERVEAAYRWMEENTPNTMKVLNNI